MLTSNTGARYMRNATPDRPSRLNGAEPAPRDPSSTSSKRPRLSHRQARASLALLLDATTPPAQAEALRQHVAGCARCQHELEQQRQAEGWLLAQPVEAPPMVARQSATWAAIQQRIAAEDEAVPLAEKAHANGHANGHAPALNHHGVIEAALLVPLVAASATPDVDEPAPPCRPSSLPHTSAPASNILSLFKKPGIWTPRRMLFVALAASLIVGSFAALFVARFSPGGTSGVAATSLLHMGVLDPGSTTPAFSFDPLSRRLLTLTGDMTYGCMPDERCPYSGPACLSFALLDVESGAALDSLRPGCAKGGSPITTSTFVHLFDDSAAGAALLVGSDQRVTAVDHSSGTIINTYSLANPSTQPDSMLLDQRDQLLLTTSESETAGDADTLVAQDATTGSIKYHKVLDTSDLQASLVSDVTGWVYLWERCAGNSTASCVEVYAAASGQKVASWQPSPKQTPLAADPTDNLVYVREDQSGGQSQTLALDGRSGAKVAQLPASAQAMAINAPLHHAYLLGNDGVTVVDTRTRQKLSTLPVLARDESWAAPAVDVAKSRVYVPIQRGKLLMVQDDPAGHLRLRSDDLAAVLEAERAMVVNASGADKALYPWELPVGPGTFTIYHPVAQEKKSNCDGGWVAARSAATLAKQAGGQQVTISLAWDDHTTGGMLTSTPTPQSSYPHEHAWLYDVPVNGTARLTSEHGEEISTC
jgi:hypothetical protein